MSHILSGKNVLVTGGAGFVGSHLVEKLLALDAKVFVLDKNFEQDGYFKSAGLENKVVIIHQDLKEFEKVKRHILENKIEYIYHIAAEAIVVSALADPLTTFESNVMG